MAFYLGKTSLKRSKGVHPRMLAIVKLALSYGLIDFMVLKDGGVRTLEEQKVFVASGASQTLKSEHLIHPDTGYGHAKTSNERVKRQSKPSSWSSRSWNRYSKRRNHIYYP